MINDHTIELIAETVRETLKGASAASGSIDPDRFYPEAFSAKLLGFSLQHHRRLRRLDLAEGTPGRRVPKATRVTERRLGFRGRAILAFMGERDQVEPAPFRIPAA
jgi:hypothetical protein